MSRRQGLEKERSELDGILSRDPIGIYARMEEVSRAAYREAVRHLARHAHRSEIDVASAALALAREQFTRRGGPRDRRCHIGYYLLDRGRQQLAASLGVRAPLRWRVLDAPPARLLGIYVCLSATVSLLLALALLTLLPAAMPVWAVIVCGSIATLAASHAGLTWISHLVRLLLPPRRLPRMDFAAGIPDDCRTLVAVPCLIGSNAMIDELAAGLERIHLDNADGNLGFCLVADFPDAPQQNLEGDAALIAHARWRIDALNARHGGGFVLLHRPRRWNAADQIWMGWERKRGKLEELNACLIGALGEGGFGARGLRERPRRGGATERDYERSSDERGSNAVGSDVGGFDAGRFGERGFGECGSRLRSSGSERGLADGDSFAHGDGFADGGGFETVMGDVACLRARRYVITLDDDMGLPADAARQLVSVMAHPLNRAYYDPQRQAVTAGYGVLQPSMYALSARRNPSRYERLSCAVSVKLVNGAVRSDTYQDLLGQGSFGGKGIYDVELFHRLLHRQLPDNQVLSHDLLEGLYIRSGLVSDIHLPEESPGTYAASMARRHRWMRGDWQLAPWLWPTIRRATGDRVRNPLSADGYWRIVDNMRRMFIPCALVLTFALGWLLSPWPGRWTIGVTTIVFAPVVSTMGLHLWLGRHRLGTQELHALMTGWFFINLINFTFIVYEARVAIDAIARSSIRMWLTRRRMLEWVPSSIVNNRANPDLRSYVRLMWVSPTFALATGLLLASVRAGALPAAAPVLLIWLCAPGLAWWLSRSPTVHASRGHAVTSG